MDSDSPKAKIEQLNDINIPDPAKKALLLHVFHKATLDRGDDSKWAEIIKVRFSCIKHDNDQIKFRRGPSPISWLKSSTSG